MERYQEQDIQNTLYGDARIPFLEPLEPILTYDDIGPETTDWMGYYIYEPVPDDYYDYELGLNLVSYKWDNSKSHSPFPCIQCNHPFKFHRWYMHDLTHGAPLAIFCPECPDKMCPTHS